MNSGLSFDCVDFQLFRMKYQNGESEIILQKKTLVPKVELFPFEFLFLWRPRPKRFHLEEVFVQILVEVSMYIVIVVLLIWIWVESLKSN